MCRFICILKNKYVCDFVIVYEYMCVTMLSEKKCTSMCIPFIDAYVHLIITKICTHIQLRTHKGRYNGTQSAKHRAPRQPNLRWRSEKNRELADALLFELLVSLSGSHWLPFLRKSEQQINGTWGLRPQLSNSDELDCEKPASERLH